MTKNGKILRKRYTSKHIVKNIKGFYLDLKETYKRAKYGYDDFDVYNLSGWFISTATQILKELSIISKNNYQDTELIDRIIFCFEEGMEETSSKQNKYQEEYTRISNEFTEKYGLLGEKLNTNNSEKAIHFPSDIPEYKELVEKYKQEESELIKYRETLLREGLELFIDNFYEFLE